MERGIKSYQIVKLDKKLCAENIEDILDLLREIPDSDYEIEDILIEKKRERILYGKWEYSLAVLDNKKIIGILIGYEREKEKSGIYSNNCFYINEVAVSKKYRGQELGKSLLKLFIEQITEYKYLTGNLIIRIQTKNSLDNKKVIELYQSIGVKKIGIKRYQNKEDIVLEIKK